jgi:2-dehydropantoate 2-reductase
MKNKLRIAIVGVGAIGGYFGMRLLERFGKDEHFEIVFIQRGEHLRQIVNNGLAYVTKDNRYRVFPTLATDNPKEAGVFDIVILCVKSYDLESSLALIKNNINKDSVIISTLNGVDIAQRIGKIYPDNAILPGCIYISTKIEKPGVITQVGGVGNFYFGPEYGQIDIFKNIENILKESRIKVVLDSDILVRLWEKYLFVGPFASITSYCNKSIGAIVADKESMDILLHLMQEVISVAECKGVTIHESRIDKCVDRAKIIPFETKTSMQLDFELQRKTELDIFTGYIVREAHNLGVSAPYHNTLYDELKKRAKF